MLVKIIILIMLMFSKQIFAQALKYSNCEVEKQIRHPKGSSGLLFDKECKTAYVKPPIEGYLKVASFASSYDSKMCEVELSGLNIISDQLKIMDETLKGIQFFQKKRNNDVQRESFKGCDEDITRHQNLSDAISEIETELLIKNSQLTWYDLCQDKESCQFIEISKLPLQTEIDRLNHKVQSFKELKSHLSAGADLCHRSEQDSLDEWLRGEQESRNQVKALIEERNDLLRQLNQEEVRLFKEAGAQISLALMSRQTNLVSWYQKNNIKLKIKFTELPISKATLNFTKINNGYDEQYPVVLKSKIHGLKINAGAFGSELFEEKDQRRGDSEREKVIGSDSSILDMGAVGGWIVINKKSACDLILSKERDPVLAISQMISPTVTYQYSAQVRRDLFIKYNESHLYQLIKKHTTRGGLFRTKSSSELVEKSEASKWIDIVLSSQDEQNDFRNAEELEKQIRSEYLDAALSRVAKSYITNEKINQIMPKENGAKVASEGLRKCPDVYCQVGAIILDVSDAIFGKSVSESNMSKILSVQESQHISYEKPIPQYGTQTLSVLELQ